MESRVLERSVVFTPLGIRFLDVATGALVRHGLEVTAWPLDPGLPVDGAYTVRGKGREAFVTPKGIHAFRDLPGMRDLEYPADGSTLSDEPEARHPFLIRVVDTRGRFLPVAFVESLPRLRIYAGPGRSGTPRDGKGFYLFSAPARRSMPGYAAVRAVLRDVDTGKRASHALIEIEGAGKTTKRGLADEDGAVAVFFPYPRVEYPAVEPAPTEPAPTMPIFMLTS